LGTGAKKRGSGKGNRKTYPYYHKKASEGTRGEGMSGSGGKSERGLRKEGSNRRPLTERKKRRLAARGRKEGERLDDGTWKDMANKHNKQGGVTHNEGVGKKNKSAV